MGSNEGLCWRCGEIEPHGMDCGCLIEPCFGLHPDHIADATERVQPAPAPLPGVVDKITAEREKVRCLREYAWCYHNEITGTPFIVAAYDGWPAVLEHISDLTRRLAEAEAGKEFYQGLAKELHDHEVACIVRAEAAEARVEKLEEENVRLRPRAEIAGSLLTRTSKAEKRCRELEEELTLCLKEAPVGILAAICNMNKILGLEMPKTSYTEIPPAIQAVVARAESAEARVRELEACFPAPLTHAQTLAKRALLAGQIEQVQKGRVVTLPCAGCSRTISLTVARKCHWCGCWYCAECSDVHFGANPDKVRGVTLAATEEK